MTPPDGSHRGGRTASRARLLAEAAWWAVRHPRDAPRSSEFFFQELGVSGLAWPDEHRGGRIRRLSPRMLAEHGQPLVDPPTLPAAAATHLRDDDPVLGVAMEGRARAYPWWILDDHHVANDTVGGRPITVTLCEACNTGMAFDPVVEGRRLTFRLGYIYNGTVAVEDRETGTVWSPYLMVGIRGKLRGTPLTQLPVAQMRWAAWRDLHPNTDVLPAELGSRTGHGSGYTMGRPELGTGMRRTMARWDERLASDSIVLGVVGRDVARVYPFDLLRDHLGVVNDSLDGVPIVALAHLTEGSFAALAFSRLLDGRELTFVAGADGPIDQETGSRWTFEGRAVAGSLEGAALEFVASSVSAWPAWPAHFPSIEIFVPD